MLLSPGVAFESGSASRRRDAWLGGLRCWWRRALLPLLSFRCGEK